MPNGWLVAVETQTLPIREELPRTTVAVLALLIAGLYLLLHPYQGLVHDARLYTLQALNHLHPELYGNDVFLKYGSQDSYTLFTPLYAAAIKAIDVEPAASLITFASVTALLVGAWSLARCLMPASLAWLGLGVLVLRPGFYGSGITFSVLEGFVTPRPLAEALVLFSLTAWLRERRLLSVGLLLIGMLIHPIMSFPAVILLVVMSLDLRFWQRSWPLSIAAALLIAAAFAGWLPIERWQFDVAWWPMADRVPHLVLGHWTPHDWARIATLAATLGLGTLYASGPARRLTSAMLITCVGTLLLSWIGGDLLKIVLVVQGQAWRSLWLATLMAALLLPWLVTLCWKGPPLRRCSALLLISAWVIGPLSLSSHFSVAAVIVAACSHLRLPERYARFAVLGAGIALAVTTLCVLTVTWSEHSNVAYAATSAPVWLKTLRALSSDGLLSCAILLSVWYAAMRIDSPITGRLLALAVAVPVLLVTTAAAEGWLKEQYPSEIRRAFASWRAIIPPGSDVLWATKFVSGSDPMGVWLMLERPSYYSSVQVNSGLFSRPAAIELSRRSKAIPLSLPTEMPIDFVFAGKLGQPPSCDDIPVRYIVTDVAIPDAEVFPPPASSDPPFDQLDLRVCPVPSSANMESGQR